MGEVKLWTSYELLEHEFPPIRWIVPNLLTSGLYLLAGAPKLGKSWLALGITSACSVGGAVLGKLQVDQCFTLYLSLEDNPRRLQTRLSKTGATASRDAIIATEWAQGRDGVEKLRKMLDTYTDLKLIVIDTWIRFAGHHDGNDYSETSTAAGALKQLADEYDTCIVLVHHTRKAPTEDFLDSVMGSTGLSAVADGTLVLRRARGNRDAVLSVTGRDIEENEYALRFDGDIGTWVMLGTSDEVQESDARQKIFDLLNEADAPMGPKAVAEALGKNHSTTKSLMQRMAGDGVLMSLSGKYRTATPRSPVVSVDRSPESETTQTTESNKTTETTESTHTGSNYWESHDENGRDGGVPLI